MYSRWVETIGSGQGEEVTCIQDGWRSLEVARVVKVCHPYGSKCALVRHAFIERLLEELNCWKVSASDLNSLDIPLWKKRPQRLILDTILGFSDYIAREFT